MCAFQRITLRSVLSFIICDLQRGICHLELHENIGAHKHMSRTLNVAAHETQTGNGQFEKTKIKFLSKSTFNNIDLFVSHTNVFFTSHYC